MSIELHDIYTAPKNLSVKAGPDMIYVGDYEISLPDFLKMTEYVLLNTDINGSKDLRLQFIKKINSIKTVPGWNKGGMRLEM